ncbi:uncharacterized protein LOC106068782 [Biomphalaria glabrata]|uniref:Uncharacterized protein LOC106068782 n=1 Tax=Biomphalaria glabrata TaxID=6526 RepID=A0A9W2Z5G4_BIOGL|nr:uncharacterized protein LOC106068782 [Biomphalaria glabrata]
MVRRIAVLLCLSILVMTSSCQVQNLVAEVYVVVEDSTVQSYAQQSSPAQTIAEATNSLSNDIDLVITQTNVLLSSLVQYGINIEVRKRKVDILSTNIINTFLLETTYIADSSAAKASFQSWLNLQNAYSTLNYDFAVLWTGFDLYGTSGIFENSITSFAAMCKSTGVSVMEFDPTARDIVATAKIIAYLLSSLNDGITSTYIMAIINAPDDANRWFYSNSSAQSIKEFVALPRASCLLSTNSASVKPAVTYATYTGSLLDPDVICQRSLNDSRSYMCKSLPQIYNNQPPKGNAVCGQIYCRIPKTSICTPAFTSDGMICENQKRCTKGQCSSYPTSSVDPNCLWGDQKTLDFPLIPFSGTCKPFLDTYGAANCYTRPINETCCNTCKTYNSGIPGCEYGDKSSACVLFTQAQVCPIYKNTLCCNYCRNYVGRRSVPEGGYPELTPSPQQNVTEVPVVGDYLQGKRR